MVSFVLVPLGVLAFIVAVFLAIYGVVYLIDKYIGG